MSLITLTSENLADEHICCGFSDKKCAESYQMKKDWLEEQFTHGYKFVRLDERAKVFIEYGPAEQAWVPVSADGYYNINCLWVSGRYKGKGWAKKLLNRAEQDARDENRIGLVTVTGKKKFHFMSDEKWFLRNGFEIADETDTGFILLVKHFTKDNRKPSFNSNAIKGICEYDEDFVAYYSNRCPFAEYHVNVNLAASVEKLNKTLKIIKFESLSDIADSPTPATIFSLFKDGQFITTDLSICMENRFMKAFKEEDFEA